MIMMVIIMMMIIMIMMVSGMLLAPLSVDFHIDSGLLFSYRKTRHVQHVLY